VFERFKSLLQARSSASPAANLGTMQLGGSAAAGGVLLQDGSVCSAEGGNNCDGPGIVAAAIDDSVYSMMQLLPRR
jgi:hypothetical protein